MPLTRKSSAAQQPSSRRSALTNSQTETESQMASCKCRFEHSLQITRLLIPAYTELAEYEILCGHNVDFDNCGSELEMMMRAYRESELGRSIIGVCYYTDNALIHLDSTGSLYLGFAEFEIEASALPEIGSTIQTVLNRNGLLTRWNGDVDTKIEIFGTNYPW